MTQTIDQSVDYGKMAMDAAKDIRGYYRKGISVRTLLKKYKTQQEQSNPGFVERALNYLDRSTIGIRYAIGLVLD